MNGAPFSDADAQGWLRMLGITSLYQWDVVVFLSQHRDSLLGADHLAGLLGYESEFILTAIEELEVLGLVRRSRLSQGARIYHFIAPSETHHLKALEQLLTLSSRRAGRLQLLRLLRRDRPASHEARQAARQRLAQAKQARRLAQKGPPSRHRQQETSWLKAI